jgi:glyoxylase-like metal-dependent hydrolase (beta-lactamase superfamily II)
MTNKRNDTQLSREILPGIFQVTLPLPGEKPGPVNAYLFTGQKITLLDTGTAHSVENLDTALSEIGLDFRDIDQILLTHGHVDHYGAASKIVQQSSGKIKVGAHEADVKRIETGFDISQETSDHFNQLMGVPKTHLKGVKTIHRFIRLLAEDCRVDFTIKEGDNIRVGNYTAQIVSTPGHSRGSVCLFLEKEGVLFSGDHILGHITPNAFVMLDDAHELPVRLSQKEFYASIAKIEQISPLIVYPAHGKTISDLAAVTEGYRISFRERDKLILSLLAGRRLTVYQIARKLFPEIGGRRLSLDISLAISEVFTHLQILLEKNSVGFERDTALQVFLT